MGRKFHIHKKNYYGPQVLYKSEWLDLGDSQIYCLVGCNGIGKSTILRQMVHDNEGSLDKTAWDLLENYVGWSWGGGLVYLEKLRNKKILMSFIFLRIERLG